MIGNRGLKYRILKLFVNDNKLIKFSVIYFSESPPLGGEGVGMSVLSHRLIEAICQVGDVVFTRRQNCSVSVDKIGRQLVIPVKITWDCAYFKLRVPARLGDFFDNLLFKLWVQLGCFKLAKYRSSKIVGLSGAKWTFLW